MLVLLNLDWERQDNFDGKYKRNLNFAMEVLLLEAEARRKQMLAKELPLRESE